MKFANKHEVKCSLLIFARRLLPRKTVRYVTFRIWKLRTLE